MKEKEYPLIIVFYLHRELMGEPKIIQPFVESVNEMIIKKDANIMAFFLPTDGEERIECINPSIVKEADMEKINKMVSEIKTSFSVGDNMEIPGVKECECGQNPGRNCQCNE